MTDTMYKPAHLQTDRVALLSLAVLQALLLLLLHKTFDHKVWPATDHAWLYACYAVALGVPYFLYLGADRWRDRANVFAAASVALLLFWAGWHAGWLAAAAGDGRVHSGTRVPELLISATIALFVMAICFRAQRETGHLSYFALLNHSWRNALTLGFLALFMLVFWLLLVLWGSLFKIIGVTFFGELFDDPEFIYPICGLVGGWGLVLIRERVGIIVTVRQMCETLTRSLLPLVAFIVVLFLGTLPFTGVEQLWKTGYASTLLLWLAAVLLFFFNAALADEDGLGIDRRLRALVLVALLISPANALLAGWSMALRVEQYGWTVDRLWAVFVLSFIGAYSIAYAVVLIRHRKLSIGAIHRVNTILALTLAAALLLANTPLLEFRRIAAVDQAQRLLSGHTDVAAFDARYIRFELGPYGRAELERLKMSDRARLEPELLAKIEDALAAEFRWSAPEDEPAEPPPTLVAATPASFDSLPGTMIDDDMLRLLSQPRTAMESCLQPGKRCVVGTFQHLNRDYLIQIQKQSYPDGRAWRKDGNDWKYVGRVRQFGCEPAQSAVLDPNQPFTPMASEFFIVRNGNCIYQPLPERAAINGALDQP